MLGNRNQVAVDVESVRKRVVRASILASGNLIYRDEAQLSPEIIARVQSVLVNEGDQVTAGQILIRLDDQTIQEAINLQRAQLAVERESVVRQGLSVENLRLDLERMRGMRDKRFVSQGQYDNASFALRQALSELSATRLRVHQSEVALEQAEQQLRRAVIKAPISGTVISLGIKPGETAVPSSTGIPGSSLLTIADKSSIMVDLNVDENDVSSLSVGGEANVICPNSPDSGLKGQIHEIALSPRRATGRIAANDLSGRSYSVKVRFDRGATAALRQGMSCRATIYTSRPEPRIAVPVQAVLNTKFDGDDGISVDEERANDASYFVYVAKDGHAFKRVVQTGAADDSYQEIRSGLAEGEAVIVGPYRQLSELDDRMRIVINPPRKAQ